MIEDPGNIRTNKKGKGKKEKRRRFFSSHSAYPCDALHYQLYAIGDFVPIFKALKL
jgi:hypothetical protein